MSRLRDTLAALRDESGWSLSELLIASTLMIAVLGAALTPFESFQQTDRRTQSQNDSQDNARNTVDNIAHQLRNVAGQTQLVERAGPFDLVFQTIDSNPIPTGSKNDRNVMRVRYCLDTANAPASLTNAVLWEQTLRWTTAAVPASLPSTVNCPDTSWVGATRRILADGITNQATSSSIANGAVTLSTRSSAANLFTYFPASSPLTQITGVRMDVWSDRRPTELPRETELTSGVLLRNQNGAPVATFSATPGSAGTKQITLNGATSSDPENMPLTYRWCDVTTISTCDSTTKVGSGQLFTYTAPASGNRQIVLQVFDAGGLESDAGPTTVAAP
jgi:type II secretory pathway pseudopilin PulG